MLGYHNLNSNEEKYFLELFEITALIVPTQKVHDVSIKLRRQYSLKLGDSLIAATAEVYDLEIYTRNLKDLRKLDQ